MNIGDVCRVIIQPKNLLPKIVGEVGFISEIKDDYALFDALKLDGSTSGAGAVPLNCLQKVNDVEWLNAKAIRDEKFDKLFKEGMKRTRHYQVLLKEVAAKHSITTKQVEEIYQELITFSHSAW